MKNIINFCIGGTGSGIFCETKEEFLQYLDEEIERIDEEGVYKNFDIIIEPNND